MGAASSMLSQARKLALSACALRWGAPRPLYRRKGKNADAASGKHGGVATLAVGDRPLERLPPPVMPVLAKAHAEGRCLKTWIAATGLHVYNLYLDPRAEDDPVTRQQSQEILEATLMEAARSPDMPAVVCPLDKLRQLTALLSTTAWSDAADLFSLQGEPTTNAGSRLDHILVNASAKARLRQMGIQPVAGINPHRVLRLHFDLAELPHCLRWQSPSALPELHFSSLPPCAQHEAAVIGARHSHRFRQHRNPTLAWAAWSADVEAWWPQCRPSPDVRRLGRGSPPTFKLAPRGRKLAREYGRSPELKLFRQISALCEPNLNQDTRVQTWAKLAGRCDLRDTCLRELEERPPPSPPLLLECKDALRRRIKARVLWPVSRRTPCAPGNARCSATMTTNVPCFVGWTRKSKAIVLALSSLQRDCAD